MSPNECMFMNMCLQHILDEYRGCRIESFDIYIYDYVLSNGFKLTVHASKKHSDIMFVFTGPDDSNKMSCDYNFKDMLNHKKVDKIKERGRDYTLITYDLSFKDKQGAG